ncbi:MAG: UDP-N-acetylmuramoyl-tripeptide--D-alanyl-D-alanine ligase [Bacteroidaceae bacterium]|nr:UDP-N-acetylmuramoyl-tripeptide--D-alanyl-D-alanine ligase [Bacteroidaceae bacterium]MCF0187369.1 UDP-N-acetylmuramoyl-tripeptide--D-alanyl-D-alanine ligase [Bacteroidaceae bacterium]
MDISVLYELFLRHPQVTTDSRDCPPGSLFFALKGESFNGNKFATHALEAGCAVAVVDEEDCVVPGDERFFLVDDCLHALQQLANHHRRKLGTPIIAVTGTNGKTTTKELISAVLMRKFNVLYTQGNYNNHIGVPKTLLRLTPEHELAVVEMGANHPGEIRDLARIVEPDYGIITNVGMAHLEGFGSFEGVLRTKGELYEFLRTRSDSRVFIHRDNPHLNGIAYGLQQVAYGKTSDAADMVNGEVVECAPYVAFRWRIGQGEWHQVESHLIGSYNLDNMLAAAAIGVFFGVDSQQIDDALAGYIPQNNRSQLTVTASNHLIVDAYNANPTSMMAALRNFREMKVEHKFVLLGDMRELGAVSEEEHQKVVDFLERCCFEQVWLVGAEFAKSRHSFRSFANVDEVNAALDNEHPSGFYILVKGSNGIRLFNAIPHL